MAEVENLSDGDANQLLLFDSNRDVQVIQGPVVRVDYRSRVLGRRTSSDGSEHNSGGLKQ
eukprot:9217835-Pyramimonas_sp.AAC.1